MTHPLEGKVLYEIQAEHYHDALRKETMNKATLRKWTVDRDGIPQAGTVYEKRDTVADKDLAQAKGDPRHLMEESLGGALGYVVNVGMLARLLIKVLGPRTTKIGEIFDPKAQGKKLPCAECNGTGYWANPAGGRITNSPCSKGCKP